ncbi:hypothetical protein [Planococcus sp. CAU13]|uniref:hypothetical protein n=1 Tax=Planococcus sp. CAU13 TaxID=1541197 RepID=UPI00052FF810|nr:hypothetical protein [Planococcus sp. CAU13]
MNEAIYFNVGDIIATIIMLGTFAVFILIFIRTMKTFKRNEKRANERLELEKETTVHLQKRIDELDERVVVIEKMLREVE